jgi:LmbE family N-acetylglucosaminyl deacetylase
MKLDASTRLLFFAPHPDDESLAAGGLLQRAAAAGVSVSVIFATNGDDNPWPLRVIERQWRIEATDRLLWGMRRMHEAREALQVLGHPPACADFLQLRDQQLTQVFLKSEPDLLRRFVYIVEQVRPTMIVAPAPFDLHPDHNAMHLLLDLALESGGFDFIPRLYYAVHQRGYHANYECVPLTLTEDEKEKKRQAILCHRSQMALSRRRFLRHVTDVEEFWRAMPARETDPQHPVRDGRIENGVLRLNLQRRKRSGSFARCTLLVAMESAAGSHRWSLPLPAIARERAFKNANNGERIGNARMKIRGTRAEVELPLDSLGSIHRLHAKLEQPSVFYDFAGWRELPTTSANFPIRQPNHRVSLTSVRARVAR